MSVSRVVDGKTIILNEVEERLANRNQMIVNDLGFKIDITTMTAISKSVVEQKFFEIAPADYLPVRVGENSWTAEILTYRDYQVAGDFESGLVNTGSNNTRLAETNGGVDSISVPVKNWAKQINWALPELMMAAKAGNWDLVTSKEKSRKKNWDLGIQKVAFLGSKADSNVKGLFTQSNVNANTTLITKKLSSMTESELNAVLLGIVPAYRANCYYTAMPTHFIIPEDDYNGLAAPSSATYPIRTKLSLLEEAFKTTTRNPNFKILPCAYANKLQNADVTGLNKNVYVLLNYDEDSLRMDIPVDYTNTLQNTINGYQYQNVGYGQFTGVKAYREREMLYFTWA